MTIAMLLENCSCRAAASHESHCSISPACRASPRSSPSTSRRRSTSCSPQARAAIAAVAHGGADLGRVRRAARGRERAHRPRLGPGRAPARGAWTARRCARPTTPTCRRSRSTGPSSARTRRCSRSTSSAAALAGVRVPVTARAGSIVENALRDFRLSGAELAADEEARFAAIQEELAKLGAKFSENVLDATNAFSIVVDDERGSPAFPPTCCRRRAKRRRRTARHGWKFTLHAPSYLPVMQYADDRALRETLYRESATRASEFGKPEWDNTPLIARIVELRRELRAAARLRELRRGVAGAEDGRVAGAGARLPRRPRAPRAALRRAATSPSCSAFARDELGSTSCRPGTSPTPPRSCARSATRSPTRK